MTVNATTNSVSVRAIFPNPRGELLPGLSRLVVASEIGTSCRIQPHRSSLESTAVMPTKKTSSREPKDGSR